MNARVSRARGTPATMSNVAAKVAMGTRSAELVFGKATGTRTLIGHAVIDLSGASITEERLLTLQLRRTNHTPVNVAHSAVSIKLGLNSGSGESMDIPVMLPPCVYALSGQAGDTVALWASLDDTAGVTGTVTIREAQIAAL